MPDLLTIYASTQPDKPAVIDDQGSAGVVTWTYAQLEAEANRLAHALMSVGVAPGQKVIWCGPNSAQVVAMMNATRKIGAVAVPLNYRLTPAEAQSIIVQRKFEPEDWLRLVDTYHVNSTFSAPPLIRLVCALPAEVKDRYDRSSMKRMLANAAPWSFALKQAYLADFPADSLWEIYGSTELGVNCVLEPKDQLRKPGSCGKPAPGVEVRLLDADGKEVTGTGPDHAGELYVRSTGGFNEYYKQPDSYEAATLGDFHTVGDIAYRDDEGYYYICDRKNDMIISGGMNIYPAEIESALEQHPGIFDVAVFGITS